MGLVTIDLSAGGSINMTDAEFNHAIFNLTGTLTANAILVVPDDSKIYHVMNATTGAFTVEVKTAAGTGITVTQGNNAVLVCDGVNVVQFA
ncbi:hypothetical protein DJ031_04690 [bacterium endosymbiont of Escarpia laminata]|nr:MAG: hypothetical protein DJ031_04690 [bacterium endosymbiont of Escarpia laminata]